MPEFMNVATPVKPTAKTTPDAPKKKKKSQFEVNYIVPREGPLFQIVNIKRNYGLCPYFFF